MANVCFRMRERERERERGNKRKYSIARSVATGRPAFVEVKMKKVAR